MKKILFVINTMGLAGAEMALLELLRKLSEQEDLEISLFVLTGQGEMMEKIPSAVKLLNAEYQNCSVHTPAGKKILMKTSLRALLRRGNCIRLFPYMLTQLFSMVRRKRILPDKLLWRALSDGAERFEEEYDLAVAYIEGGSTYYVADHVNAKKKAAFFHVDYEMAGYTRQLDRVCYLSYDKVFPVSEEVKEAFLKVYPECTDRTEVFPNIIDADRVLKMSRASGGFTDEYVGYRILTVGRLTEQKDFARSIEAMKLLKEKGIKARWYILGEGEQREELEKLIQKNGLEKDFYLPGTTDNPYVFMAQADVYVHATGFEGKSIAVQEAQILGCAILVSDCNGNREQVQHDVDGLLCEFTPEGICAGIQSLLENEEKRKEYGLKAAERHKNNVMALDKILSLI